MHFMLSGCIYLSCPSEKNHFFDLLKHSKKYIDSDEKYRVKYLYEFNRLPVIKTVLFCLYLMISYHTITLTVHLP